MGRALEDILEMQFRLAYHKIMSPSEFEAMHLTELEWMYGRLQRQKQDEHEVQMKQMMGNDYKEHNG